MHCSVLAEEAINAAIEDYKKKNPQQSKKNIDTRSLEDKAEEIKL